MMEPLPTEEYAFAANFVEFVMNCGVETRISLRKYPHPTPVRPIRRKVGTSIETYLRKREAYIGREFFVLFPKTEGPVTIDVFCERMDYFKLTVLDDIVLTIVDLIEFCIFISYMARIALAYEVTDAPYKAIDIVHRNVCDYIQKREYGHAARFWRAVRNNTASILLGGEENMARIALTYEVGMYIQKEYELTDMFWTTDQTYVEFIPPGRGEKQKFDSLSKI